MLEGEERLIRRMEVGMMYANFLQPELSDERMQPGVAIGMGNFT